MLKENQQPTLFDKFDSADSLSNQLSAEKDRGCRGEDEYDDKNDLGGFGEDDPEHERRKHSQAIQIRDETAIHDQFNEFEDGADQKDQPVNADLQFGNFGDQQATLNSKAQEDQTETTKLEEAEGKEHGDTKQTFEDTGNVEEKGQEKKEEEVEEEVQEDDKQEINQESPLEAKEENEDQNQKPEETQEAEFGDFGAFEEPEHQ